MDILITGHTSLVGADFFQKFYKKNKIVLCGDDEQQTEFENARSYQFKVDSLEFEKLFSTYNFAYVIYISYCMESNAYKEPECLEKVLSLCRKREDTFFVYINPSEAVTAQQREEDGVIRNAAKALCDIHTQKGGSLLDLKVPYLAGESCHNGHMAGLLEKAYKKKKLSFSSAPDQKLDILFEEDLSEMLSRFFDEQENGVFSYTLSGKNERSVESFVEELKEAGVKCKATFGKAPIVPLKADAQVREKYGWFPLKTWEEVLSVWVKALSENTHAKKRKKRLEKRLYSGALQLAEFIFMYVVCELLTKKTSGLSLINYVDFRMFFVVISGMMYGLKHGMAAAFLSCITYFVSGDMGENWQIQFYNIVNWLPFAIYMLSGAIAGYTKDSYMEKLQSGREEQSILEKKYIYLNELYMSTLENKEQYSSQITNYVNSFGRIYDVTKQLNTVLPGEIYNVAVNVMEDMLENYCVAIYAVDNNSSFARLGVCSKNLADTLGKSLDLTQKAKLRKILENGETWVNRERLEDYPDYAYPIFKEGELVGIIMILEVDYRQMNTDYLNRFQILAGLISDSLIRAGEYQELVEKDILVEDTRIWKAEAFERELELQRQMKEKNRADFVLLRVVTKEKDYRVLDRRLQKCIRQRDRIGLGEDGQLYLLLTQADERNVDIVKERLKGTDIMLEIA